MQHVDDFLLFWILSSIHSCGLFCAWLTRRHAGTRRQSLCEWLFLAFLVLVGLSTLTAMLHGRGGHWVFGGATLGTMVLMAVWDFKSTVATTEHRVRIY